MRNKAIVQITTYAMILALILLMTFIPQIGYITVGPISITTIHLVVLVCAVVFGWKEATVAGLIFGLACLLKAFALPTAVTDVYFQNPLISVVPRLLFGFIAGWTFEGIKRISNNSLRYTLALVSLVVLTFIHSVMTLGAYWLFANDPDVETISWIITAIFSINGTIEMGEAFILVPPISYGISVAMKGRNPGMKLNNLFQKKRKTNKTYVELTKPYSDLLLENLTKFVAINSVYDPSTATKTNPYGKGVSKALKFIHDLAISDGFRATIYDNQVVEILIGSGEKNITIMSHADTVPTGDGWESDPFTVVNKDGVLYGRGVSDDKGPTLAAYYGVKALNDKNLLGNYTVRLLVGGNEERGSSEMDYYFHTLNKPQPTFGFTPDGDYPLIFAEKGIINYVAKGDIPIPGVISIKGGVAANSVIDKCTVVLNHSQELLEALNKDKVHYEVTTENDIDTITIFGVGAHGSMPEKGVNAGLIALRYLGQILHHEEVEKLYKAYENVNGLGLDCYCHSDKMGLNTLNVGIINYEDGHLSMVVNFRYVENADRDEMWNNIIKKSAPLSIENSMEDKLLYYPTDSTLIQTLMDVYKDETGDVNALPIAIGGGTYAKEADNVVCFGMEDFSWDTYMHSAKERVKIADLEKAMAMYAHAVIELGKKIDEN
ncbi:MAG: Sapep family Mn(2+)-dependent dipeptidase [Coprobacillus sp.]|nr:Sapep family Mn(2+)-dependent dipeptidase [Coprobacillus sp.]